MPAQRSPERANGHPTVGTNLRLLRTRHGLTARALAAAIDVSPSLISKIESGASNASVDVLRKIAQALHVSLGDLMDPAAEPPPTVARRVRPGRIALVQPDERKLLRVTSSGMVFQLLTPDAQGGAEFVWIEIEPGEGGLKPLAHEQGEESVLVLAGEVTVYIQDTPYVVRPGACLTFDATLPHRYRNEGTAKAVWLYVCVPPTL